MRKKNVFLVTGRYRDAGGDPRGDVVDCIVCGTNEASARQHFTESVPNFSIATFTGLLALENRAKKAIAVLAEEKPSWLVLVEPALRGASDAGAGENAGVAGTATPLENKVDKLADVLLKQAQQGSAPGKASFSEKIGELNRHVEMEKATTGN